MPENHKKMPAAVVAGIVAFCILAPRTAAQTPTVGVYFEDNLWSTLENCQGVGTLDTLFVIADGFDAWVSAIEYSVDFGDMSGVLMWVADLPVTILNIGTTPEGVATTWSIPQNGFAPLVVMQVLITWTCDDCIGHANLSLAVAPHPLTGHLRAVRYPDRGLLEATGLAALLCATCCPAETATWGGVKALYGD